MQRGFARLMSSAAARTQSADAFGTLGIAPNASAAELKRAYRRRALRHHPDTPHGDAATFKKINSAYDAAKQLIEERSARAQSGATAASEWPSTASWASAAGTTSHRTRYSPDGYARQSRQAAAWMSGKFDHREWDRAHYGIGEKSMHYGVHGSQSDYVRMLHRQALGARRRERERERARRDSSADSSDAWSFSSFLLSAIALGTVYSALLSNLQEPRREPRRHRKRSR